MLSFAIIVFREVLEIAIIVGVLWAATRHLPGKSKWITCGILLGAAGSIVVAYFADRISSALEGMGQEIFNATVLIGAAVLIGWTIVWMRRHAKALVHECKQMSSEVLSGRRPLYAIAVAVALNVLRDGSEIVMFTYGTIASGLHLLSLVGGGVLGLMAGVGVGVAVYYGLLKASMRWIFSLTNWMLILLAAGMMAQAIGFLQAAGVVPEYVQPVWDTSPILSEHSLLGQILHTLIGYIARPSAIQLGGYLFTACAIALALKFLGTFSNVAKMGKVTAVIVLFWAVLLGSPQSAWATRKVYSPIVEGGEWEFEWRGGYAMDKREDLDGQQKQKYAVGYGVTNRWFTELYGEIEKEVTDSNFKFTSLEWENRYQFFEQGKYWLDAGAYLSYETSFEKDHPDLLEWKLLLEKSIYRFVQRLNLIFQKEVGGDAEAETQGGIAFSSHYRWRPYLEPGFEWYSDFGALNKSSDFNEQTHLAGPVVYGKVGPVKYDIGYLVGVSHAAPQGQWKWILEYERRF